MYRGSRSVNPGSASPHEGFFVAIYSPPSAVRTWRCWRWPWTDFRLQARPKLIQKAGPAAETATESRRAFDRNWPALVKNNTARASQEMSRTPPSPSPPPPPSPPSASPPRVYEVCPLPLIAQSRVLGRVSGALFSFQLPMLNHGTVDGHTGDLSSVQSKQKNRTTPGFPRPANYHCLLISSIGELGPGYRPVMSLQRALFQER